MNDPVLDLSRLTRLERLGGRELVTTMIETFATAAAVRRTALQQALGTGDLVALADAAHTIVAGAGQLGATTLAADARAVEEAARSGDSTAALGRTPALLASYDTALAALRQAQEAR
jgi:HPt (histidine-containing phosphotransfer) domain-containing protein